MHIFSYGSFARGMIDLLYDPSEQVKKEAFDRAMNTPKFVTYDCATEFMKNYDIRDRVSEIKVPTLIIVGEKDEATPAKMSQFLNREIEGSKLQIISDTKHMPLIDKAKELNEIIQKFIE